MTARRALVLAWALASSGCGAQLMKLPAGPGMTAPDAEQALTQAVTACRRISTITAEIGVSGSVGGRRVGRVRLAAGLAAPASARLEAVAPFGQPFFIFVATGDDATLLLPREDQVLEHGRPEDVLEAVAGVPLDIRTLRAVVTGCAFMADLSRARQVDTWRIVPDGNNELYVRRDEGPGVWRLVAIRHLAVERLGWRAEYRDFQDGLARAIRLISSEPGRFDLTLTVSQVSRNAPLGSEAFRIQIPKEARPITLTELRQSGPLRANEP